MTNSIPSKRVCRFACSWLLLSAAAFFLSEGAFAGASSNPSVASGYSLSTFASAPSGSSAPDSIAIVQNTVWIGYGNGGKPDGSDGAKSTIVEYSMQGKAIRSLTIVGHNDGLRLDPNTHKLWAMQNEDSNPNLVLINPETGEMESYKMGNTPHGGGYDDIAFAGADAYVSASNPSADSKGNVTGPSIVRMTLSADHTGSTTPVLPAGVAAADATTGKTVTLNLTDPDSFVPMPDGTLLLDDQGDAQLILVKPAQAGKPEVRVLPLAGGVQVDDTVFVTAVHGYLLVSDRDANVVYKLRADTWTPGTAFTASTGVPASTKPPITPAIPAFVGSLDLKSGVTAPVISNMASPHGMAFIPAE
jgi:hypothetical protein